ncbi:MAG: heavy metal sensor histidine kinase [Planctomycetota bacterium]|nr:heavy metal sensor histidine kinase [Planctomycetota bacterium]
MSRLSIRWRLTLWNTAALAVLLLVVGLLVYGLLRHAMLEQIDRVLIEQFHELEHDLHSVEDPESRIRHWIEEFHEHVGALCVVYSDGVVVARTDQMAAQSVPDRPANATGESRFDSRRLPLIGRQRMLTRALDANGSRFDVVLMLPMDEVYKELRGLAAVLLTVLPISLLLAGGIGYALARRALAPVERIRQATDEITAEQLSRRLDVQNSGDELGRLAQTINAMIARLEQSFAEVRRFTADASHELRTPIAVIRAEAEVAMHQPPDAEEFQTLAGSILEECEHLTKLIDQLLMLSREDAGLVPLESQPIDLARLVADATEMMRPLAEAKQQTLTLDSCTTAVVTGDCDRLREVIYNLLDNAIKYTPSEDCIEVTVTEQSGMIAVAVRDTGIGIDADHLPRVFDRFYRVDKSRSREAGGTGLGLSIVQSIVWAHGGRVDIASTPGEGTTCTVLLPRSGSDPPT